MEFQNLKFGFQNKASQNTFLSLFFFFFKETESVFPISSHLSGFTLKAWASLVAQRLKCLPTMRETLVRSLGREDSPEEGNSNPL